MTHFKLSPKQKAARVFSYLFMALCVLVALFPIVWVVLSSFKTNREILSNGLQLPSTFSFSGYKQALEMAPILKFFVNSLIVSFASTALNVFILAMAGYVFAKKKFRFKNLIFGILSLSMVIPSTALMSPVYTVITKLHLYDTKMALILVYTALSMPISLMILRSAFAAIPTELEEAAYIDGAGFFRTFWQVMMPCAKGGLASAAVLAFLESWNEFTFALLLTSSTSTRTLPLSLSYFTSQFSFNYTAMFAAITIAVLPSIIVFSIFQEQVCSSLTAGSVKG
ncbi:MAG: carbohydrate ABC transporter permease [Escherichia coli]|uniref:carbohydrate ABC transporter permease n=1 Tax=Dysosmobacter sp. TaxID=2591382 RepID=UPI001A36F461|nr:carbohydrate ABC transporter permease [Escherichia coli]